jgi:ABC-2 type transport system permease protein
MTGLKERLERVWALVTKEFRQVFRDPRLARLIFVAPVIQLVVFGYAVTTDIDNTATFVVDHSRTQDSRELVDAITASGYFQIRGRSDRASDLVRALDHGEAVVGVVIPVDYAARLRSREGAQIQILVDGTNSNTASLALGYMERIVFEQARAMSPTPIPVVVDLRERPWFNPNLESQDYNVPAVVGALIMLICLLLTSLAVVREREIGTLEQLSVSPLTPAELIAGKSLPFALIGLFDLVVVTAVALYWFQVPFRGSLWCLLLSSLLYIMSGLGLGLLISTVSATQQEAFLASFLVFQPTILLSGFMFPVSSMPEVLQIVTLINPMRHYIEIVRSIFLKGTGLVPLWDRYAALFLIGSFLLWLASTRFRKTAA